MKMYGANYVHNGMKLDVYFEYDGPHTSQIERAAERAIRKQCAGMFKLVGVFNPVSGEDIRVLRSILVIG